MLLSLAEVLNKKPSELYLGIVELEDRQVIGVVDEPMGLDLPSVHLGFPIDFLEVIVFVDASKSKTKSEISFILPSKGLRCEKVIETTDVDIYYGDDPIGKAYLEALGSLQRAPHIAEYKHIYPLASPNQ